MEKDITNVRLPVNLKHKVKVKAVTDRTTVTDVITELLERWVKGDIKLLEKEKLAA